MASQGSVNQWLAVPKKQAARKTPDGLLDLLIRMPQPVLEKS
jgi:hypothetical protein